MPRLFTSLLFLINFQTQAGPYIPKNSEQVLYVYQNAKPNQTSDQTEDFNAVKQSITSLLNDAAIAGNEHFHQLAKNKLKNHIDNTTDTELYYHWAKILQHEHRFDDAVIWLNKLLSTDKNHIAARLMSARIALIRQQPQLALSHCTLLVGVVDVLTSTICLAEAQSHVTHPSNDAENKAEERFPYLKSNYDLLSNIAEEQPLSDEHRLWLNMILADMALRQDLLVEAKYWIDTKSFFENSSYLFLWADIYLQNKLAQTVLNQLKHVHDRIVQNKNSVSDGHLLRMALAEKQLNTQKKTTADEWQKRISERMQLRKLREDTEHASEMARYFLFIKEDPAEAHHWAKINWEQAREHQDEQLLELTTQALKQQ